MKINGYRRNPMALLFVLTGFLLFAAASPPCPAADPSGQLSFSVVIVDELTPRPVPLTDFKVTAEFGDHPQQILRTDDNGKIEVKLAPGSYTIESVQARSFKGQLLSWKRTFTVEDGKTAEVRLTDSDALKTEASEPHGVSEEGQVYLRLKNGVATVQADEGQGSGFVVDPAGLVITNAHVVHGSRHIALRFEPGKRVDARAIEEDPVADIAVLQFDPRVLKDFVVLPLADPQPGPIAVVGEKVVAIGSPLHQEKILTAGIISQVQPDRLIVDVNINPGNSGGPLINLSGRAIGVTAFVDPGRGTAGVGGCIPITKVLPVLAKARAELAALPAQQGRFLPDISVVLVPTEALNDAAHNELKPVLIKEPHNFQTVINTPFIISSVQATLERELDKARKRHGRDKSGNSVDQSDLVKPRPYWQEPNSAAVVTIDVAPLLKETSSSWWRRMGTATLLGTVGVVSTGGRMDLEYRDDFSDMQLLRGDVVVEPVRTYRLPANVFYLNGFVKAKDSSHEGRYLYDPSAFEPGKTLTLRVRREAKDEKWDSIVIPEKTRQMLWEQFAPWRDAQRAK